MWTLSLCMTGAIVLGTIAAVDSTRREGGQTENEYGNTVYMESEKDLFSTLEETEFVEQEYGIAANADGTKENRRMDGEDIAESETELVHEEENSYENGTFYEEENETKLTEEAVVSASVNHLADSGMITEQTLLNAGVSFDDKTSLIWPSAGTILIDYSMDSSIYFPTLNQYKYNPALIIGSEVGNQVLASAKGIVESVTINEETGTTMILNIGNGYRLTYGQLKEMTVEPGDVVEAGAVLGYVSEPTKYYSTEGSNLYFKMTQEEIPVDPILYLE